MSSACGKVVMVVGVVVALALMFVSVLNIGLYGGAMDLDYDTCQGPCRERTGALGIVAGVFGFLVGIGVIVVLVLPLVVPAMAEPLPSLVAKLVLLVCLFLVTLFYIVAWSLMAKDIDDFRDGLNGACDDMAPDVWNAALAFGLFGFFLAIALFIVVTVALVVDRSGGGGGGGGGGSSNQHPAKDEYAA
jgi:hypothetical protein